MKEIVRNERSENSICNNTKYLKNTPVYKQFTWSARMRVKYESKFCNIYNAISLFMGLKHAIRTIFEDMRWRMYTKME